mgnify:CR=1 FL=1
MDNSLNQHNPIQVSVVVPLFNEAESLPELTQLIEANLQAANHTFEIIFVDDGSTDDSVEIIKRYASLNSHIHFIRKEKNEGLLQGIKDITENSLIKFGLQRKKGLSLY